MATRGWSGQPPTDAEQARERLMDAAIACLQRYGFEKTGVGDIAAAAGVTKPTIYNYFDSRDELLQSALTRAGGHLAERIVAHARRFETPADQVVEAVLFCLREIPNEPGLAVSSRSQEDGFGPRMGLRPASLALSRQALEALLAGHPGVETDLEELAETVVRWLLSLLTLEGPRPRGEPELRALLHRRMVPGLGLGQPNHETD